MVDASAVLAFLQGEPGAEVVEQSLAAGATCGAVNWSETCQKVLQRGGDWELARALLLSYGVSVEPVDAADAEQAARLWTERPELSLGDRMCLALAERLGVEALTADTAWGSSERVRQIR